MGRHLTGDTAVKRPTLVVALLVAAMLVASLAFSGRRALISSPPSPPEPGLYFPTTVGDRWSYELNGQNDVFVFSVESVEDGDGGAKLVSERRLVTDTPHSKPTVWVYSVTPRGLAVVAAGGKPKDRPEVLLKLDTAIGESWETTTLTGWPSVRTMRGMETVEVPAGTFKAVRVDWEWTDARNRTGRGSDWFATGAGLVKYVCTEGPSAGNVRAMREFVGLAR